MNSAPLQVAAGRPEPRPRRRLGLLVQRRHAVERQRQRPARRHGEPRRRQHGHRRHARLARDAARGDAGHRLRGRQADGRRHRLRRLQRRDRRQPHDVRQRHGRQQGRPQPHRRDEEAARAWWQVDGWRAIEFETGHVQREDAAKSAPFKEIAGQIAGPNGGPAWRRSSVNAGILVGGAFGHHIVDVEVDPDTGKVTILRYTAVQDVGTAIHPSYVEGQMQGGVVQGIGWALNEEYYYDEDGRMANSSFLDYRMPTALDVPMIETIIVEVPNPGHPYGVRGVGEVPIVPPLAAIANAIYHATGVRQTKLPMSPRRILETTQGIE